MYLAHEAREVQKTGKLITKKHNYAVEFKATLDGKKAKKKFNKIIAKVMKIAKKGKGSVVIPVCFLKEGYIRNSVVRKLRHHKFFVDPIYANRYRKIAVYIEWNR